MPDSEVLVLAPTGRDAAVIAEVLAAGGRAAAVCGSIEELCEASEESAGAAVMAGEALDPPALERLAACLSSQPPWSDLPIILLVGNGSEGEARWRALSTSDALGNVVLLERPMRREALLSAVRVALKARHRQYEIRDLLEQLQQRVQERDELLERERDHADERDGRPEGTRALAHRRRDAVIREDDAG